MKCGWLVNSPLQYVWKVSEWSLLSISSGLSRYLCAVDLSRVLTMDMKLCWTKSNSWLINDYRMSLYEIVTVSAFLQCLVDRCILFNTLTLLFKLGISLRLYFTCWPLYRLLSFYHCLGCGNLCIHGPIVGTFRNHACHIVWRCWQCGCVSC